MRLTGKRALITGAGFGLGRAIALEFARAGCEVIVGDRDAERVQSVVAEIGSGFGVVFDVSKPEQIAEARERIKSERGPIDILVNNAGVVFGGAFADVPLEQHQRTIEINLTGLINVTYAYLPDLIGRPESRLINVASASAVLALPLAATYSASKWGVLGFSESMREELRLLGHRHVGVSTICPSYISTGLFEGARPAKLTRLLTPERVAIAVRKAAERGTHFVMLPRSARMLYSVTSLMPRPWQNWICRRLGVSTSMANWKGRNGGWK